VQRGAEAADLGEPRGVGGVAIEQAGVQLAGALVVEIVGMVEHVPELAALEAEPRRLGLRGPVGRGGVERARGVGVTGLGARQERRRVVDTITRHAPSVAPEAWRCRANR